MNRRTLLRAGAASAALNALPASENRRKLGLTIWSYQIRWRTANAAPTGWNSALDVLAHCRDLGAGCLQIGVKGWTSDFADKVRSKRESFAIALEGQISLPWKEGDLPQFEREIRAAKEAGASVLRTVCLNGRRYENFHDLETWKAFERDSKSALERAEPVVARHRVQLAVENHKDWRSAEQRTLLEGISSEWVGVNFDFGNNFSLLEHPLAAVKALAPFILTTHVKDMALADYDHGFLLSEVPLGQGVIDLGEIMKICESARPGIWFNLEMITRDPLQIPVLGKTYFATMGQVPASDLAESLKMARAGKAENLPRVTGMSAAEQIAFEEKNVRQSFRHAREQLGFS